MADRRPGHLVAGEADTVRALLQFQRESLVRKVIGVSEKDARWSPVPSGTSLLWLMKHASLAERIWVLGRFADRRAEVGHDRLEPCDTLGGAVAYYRLTWTEVDRIVDAAAGLDQRALITEPGSPGVNLRWILMHLLEETARHAGHADIIREMLDGAAGR